MFNSIAGSATVVELALTKGSGILLAPLILPMPAGLVFDRAGEVSVTREFILTELLAGVSPTVAPGSEVLLLLATAFLMPTTALA